MPQWIHDRARRIMASNPDMEEGLAFALATQQSHALGKSPKGYGTEEGRQEAGKKYRDPKAMKKQALRLASAVEAQRVADARKRAIAAGEDPDTFNEFTSLLQPKTAFVEALPTLTGLATGYGPGRSVAGETAAALAPQGRVQRSENMARNAAVIGAPLGGLVAMGLARKYNLAPRLGATVAKKFPKGLIAEPSVEQELVNLGVPGVAAITGSLAGGGLSGGLVGGIQRLRGPLGTDKEAALKPSPMWGTIGGQARTPAWRAQAGFTPTGMNTAAQRLQKSMGTGKFNRDKGLKPLDLGKMQQAAQSAATGVKMGQVMFILTKTALDQKGEKEDAEIGDEDFGGENEPQRSKVADDGGVHGGFSTNQYSGVMNPPSMVYASGIPSWREAPVKTKVSGPPSEEKTAAGLTPMSRLNSARAIGAPRVAPAPGPSIAQIAKPKGFGMPMSGAKKGNNII